MTIKEANLIRQDLIQELQAEGWRDFRVYHAGPNYQFYQQDLEKSQIVKLEVRAKPTKRKNTKQEQDWMCFLSTWPSYQEFRMGLNTSCFVIEPLEQNPH